MPLNTGSLLVSLEKISSVSSVGITVVIARCSLVNKNNRSIIFTVLKKSVLLASL